MANGTYDKSLTSQIKISYSPTQFRPSDEVTFTVQYSPEFSNKYLVFTVNYPCADTHQNYSVTRYVSSSQAGTYFEKFTIPGGTFYQPSPTEITAPVYTVKANASFYAADGTSPDMDKLLGSSEEIVNLLLIWDTDYYYADPNTGSIVTGYTTNKSTATVRIDYDMGQPYGKEGSTSVRSYRMLLYNSNNALVRDSGEMLDWSSTVYRAGFYTFTDLKDNSTYYVNAKVTLSGGYVLNYGRVPIRVNYAGTPDYSDRLSLQSTPNGVKISLDLTGVSHSQVVISRTVYAMADYLNVADVQSSGDEVEAIDHYAVPKQMYMYRTAVYNGDTVTATYYNVITYTSGAIKISDILGSFYALGNITKHPISRNDRGSILETMDSKYPYHVMNAAPDYDSGQVDALFAEVDDECAIDTNNGAYADILRAWLNNGHAKLLTYYNGESWIVTVTGIQTTDPENNDVYNTSFNWTQIGDANKLSEYVRLGLVIFDG